MADIYGTTRSDAETSRRFTGGEEPVAVYGLGKMGLPLAAVFADVTGNAIGVDIDDAVVESVNRGESHVANEPGLPDLVEQTVSDGALRATTDGEAAAAEAAVHVIIVPTLLSAADEPDLSTIHAVLDDIAPNLGPGEMVFLESTVPPGTTRGVVLERLAEESDCSADEFGLAFCPERTSSGRALRDIRESYPKVVGGIDDESTAVAELLYDDVTANRVIGVSDATTAEAVKIFEGLYRDCNIALANQVAVAGEELGIDSREAIRVANTQPLCDILDPGPGVGGHCIPVYPHFLLHEYEESLPLLRAVREMNDRMPAYVVSQTERLLGDRGVALADATVAVYGLTYKPGVTETRNAPALSIIDLLAAEGATVLAVDPLVTREEQFEPATLTSGAAVMDREPDAALVVTDHEEFGSVPWHEFPRETVLVDCRDLIPASDRPQTLYRLGAGVMEPPEAEPSTPEHQP